VRYCSGFKPFAATWAVVVVKLSLLKSESFDPNSGARTIFYGMGPNEQK
jgi:hypothetical protein